MALSLEQRIRKFKSDKGSSLVSPQRESPAEIVRAQEVTNEGIDLSRVIRQRSTALSYSPPGKREIKKITVEEKLEVDREIAEKRAALEKLEAVIRALQAEEEQRLEELRRIREEIARDREENLHFGTPSIEDDFAKAKDLISSQAELIREQAEKIGQQSSFLANLEEQKDYYTQESRRKDEELIDLRYTLKVREAEKEQHTVRLQKLESDLAAIKDAFYRQQEIEKSRQQELDAVLAAKTEQEKIQQQHEEEIVRLRDAVSLQESNVLRSRELTRALESELESARARLSLLQDVQFELLKEQELRRSHEQAIIDLQARVDAKEKEAEVQEAEAQEAKEQLATVQAEFDALRGRLFHLQNVQLELLKEQELSRSHEQAIVDLQAKIDAKEKEAETAQDKLQTLQARFDALQSELSQPQDETAFRDHFEENARLKGQIEQLVTQTAEKEAEITELQQQIQGLNNKLESLKNTLQVKDQIIREQIQTIKDTKDRITDIEIKRASENDQILRDLNQVQSSKKTLESKIAEHERTNAALRADLENANGIMKVVSREKSRMDKAFAFVCIALLVIGAALIFTFIAKGQLSREIKGMSATLQQNQRLIQAKIEKINVLNQEIEKNSGFIKEQASKIATLNKNVISLDKDVTKQKRVVRSLKRALNEKKEEILKLTAELEETKLDFFEYREKISFPAQGNLLEDKNREHLAGKIQQMELALKDQVRAIDRQTEILDQYSLNEK